MTVRVWFITGASTGFGRSMTELALQKGDIVAATARKPKMLDDLKAKYPASKFISLKLDVSNTQEIKDAFSKVAVTFGRIDVVFNNAGYAIMGEIEGVPVDDARTLFDTNFWGATNVSREAVRVFREENKPSGGILINNSSVVGVQAHPGSGYYAASKHALEGFTQALALELDPKWKIRVSLVEPGMFHTDAPKKLGAGDGYSHPAYSDPTLPSVALRSFFQNTERYGRDPAKGVQRIYDLSLLPEPPLRFPLGPDAVDGVKSQVKLVEKDAEKYASWSEGLDFDA